MAGCALLTLRKCTSTQRLGSLQGRWMGMGCISTACHPRLAQGGSSKWQQWQQDRRGHSHNLQGSTPGTLHLTWWQGSDCLVRGQSAASEQSVRWYRHPYGAAPTAAVPQPQPQPSGAPGGSRLCAAAALSWRPLAAERLHPRLCGVHYCALYQQLGERSSLHQHGSLNSHSIGWSHGINCCCRITAGPLKDTLAGKKLAGTPSATSTRPPSPVAAGTPASGSQPTAAGAQPLQRRAGRSEA